MNNLGWNQCLWRICINGHIYHHLKYLDWKASAINGLCRIYLLFFTTFLNEGSICDSRYIETLFCKMLLCCFSVSDISPYIVCHETKESEILCFPGHLADYRGSSFMSCLWTKLTKYVALKMLCFAFLNTLSGIKNVVFNSNFIISYSSGLKWVSRHWLRQRPGCSQHWLKNAWD